MGGSTQQPNAFQQSAGALTGGLNLMGQGAQTTQTGTNAAMATLAPGMVPMTMNQYLNPYQDQVIGNTMGRMRDEMNMGLNDVRSQAARAGAYGGARQGLVEAELMDRYQRNMGEAAAQMNMQGFNTAASLGQNRIGQLMQGAGLVQAGGGQMANIGQGLLGGAQTAYGLGQSANQGQMQAGAMQQQLMQQLLGMGAQQYDTFANYPQQALSTALAGLSGNPLSQAGTQTSGYKPGMFDYLSFGAGLMGGGK